MGRGRRRSSGVGRSRPTAARAGGRRPGRPRDAGPGQRPPARRRPAGGRRAHRPDLPRLAARHLPLGPRPGRPRRLRPGGGGRPGIHAGRGRDHHGRLLVGGPGGRPCPGRGLRRRLDRGPSGERRPHGVRRDGQRAPRCRVAGRPHPGRCPRPLPPRRRDVGRGRAPGVDPPPGRRGPHPRHAVAGAPRDLHLPRPRRRP